MGRWAGGCTDERVPAQVDGGCGQLTGSQLVRGGEGRVVTHVTSHII